MVERLQVGEQWYILATSSPADERRRVLKYDDTFALFDRFGDIQPVGLGEKAFIAATPVFSLSRSCASAGRGPCS